VRQARLVPASLTHVGPIAVNMREPDRRECEALGKTPKGALRLSLRTAFEAWTALDPDDGRPLAMFGVTPHNLMLGTATPWFLGRDEVFDYGRDLMARGPAIIGSWLEVFSEMENIVSVENVRAIRLLRKWGAEFSNPISRHRGLEFVSFRFAR
jgi:hypothetical protein